MRINDCIKVGIGDGKIAEAPESIATIGLGSCVGVSFYDEYKKIVGLVHIMLPDSTQFKTILKPYKYADLAIPLMLQELQKKGCNISRLEAKIVGGASMFNFAEKNMTSDVGRRNIEATEIILKRLSIPIIARDVGGNKGRTMSIDASDGIVKIRKVGSNIISI